MWPVAAVPAAAGGSRCWGAAALANSKPGEPRRRPVHNPNWGGRAQGGDFKLVIRHNGEQMFVIVMANNDFTIEHYIPGNWECDLERLAIKGDPNTNTPPARLH